MVLLGTLPRYHAAFCQRNSSASSAVESLAEGYRIVTTTAGRTRERQLPCTATNINKNYELGGRGEGEFLLFIETWV